MPDPNSPLQPAPPTASTQAAPNPPNPSPTGESALSRTWSSFVVHLRSVKEFFAAVTAVAAAVAFALNYFATSRALDCFKTEVRNSNELVQTVLQINDLTASWQLTTVKLRQLDNKSKAPNIAPDSPEYEAILKDVVATQSQIGDITTRLTAARNRKITLERSAKMCD